MQKFDCLAKDLPLLGPHFLEASAGTGKTFAIEHIVARLLLHGIDLEQILVVTFTRAATRELKLRIRANLARTQGNRIADALSLFDRCQIFTIHGFCQRMLKEYAFEAGLALGEKDGSLDAALRDFLELKLTRDIVCPEQLNRLGPIEEWVHKLKKVEAPPAKNFVERQEEYRRALAEWTGGFGGFQRDQYKKAEGDFEGQIANIENLAWQIRDKHSVFSLQKKVKTVEPPFMEWGRVHLLPLIESAKDPKEIFNAIVAAWKPIQERVLAEAGHFGPDELLTEMQKAIQLPQFKQKVQKKYRAVLIDEFQDTDPIQWDIFQTLFLQVEALYLIGDPKQSIYRFRKADLYTYLNAKSAVSGHYYLDTNYRSSKQLIHSLNGLFNRDWLHLPREKTYLPYTPVKAGLDLPEFEDGAVRIARLQEDDLCAYVAREILALHLPWNAFAVLVKDRYRAAEMQRALTAAGIPSIARSQELLTETLAFEVVVELFEALHNPRKAKAVFAGPLCIDSTLELRTLLDEKGLAAVCQKVFHTSEYNQILELIFEWEREEGFSFEGLKRFFNSLRNADPEEAVYSRQEVDPDAVQIMTMHVSKGLEFDVVFALGVSTRTPECDEEAEAEKLRQLYVAFTRAKRRLYIPLVYQGKEAKLGTHSPMELFCRHLSQDEFSQFATVEDVVSPVVFEPRTLTRDVATPPSYKIPPFQPSYMLSFTAMAQETKRAAPLPEAIDELPRGAETGVAIHKIFERVFTETTPLEQIVAEEFGGPWEKVVVNMVNKTLDLELPIGVRLRDVKDVRVEMEFLYQDGANYVKGFIDLLFRHEGKVYFVDWKTNWLEDYTPEKLDEAIRANQYDLQASIYAEALRREVHVGGAIYIFVRGPACLKI